jgi:hypothetical protein
MPPRPTNKEAANVLADAGRALYGEHWRQPLGEETGVNPETLRRFMSGRMTIPNGLLDHLLRLVRQRIDELVKAAMRIEKLRGKEN